MNIKGVHTSAKTGEGVHELFYKIAEDYFLKLGVCVGRGRGGEGGGRGRGRGGND